MWEKGNVSECLVRGKCPFGVWRWVLTYCYIVIHTLLSEGFFLPAGDSWTKIVLFIPCCCNHLKCTTRGTLYKEYWKLTAKGAVLLLGKHDFMVYFAMSEILIFFENSWLILSAVDYINDSLSFITYVHPYYIQERPVTSIIIINDIVIAVVIIIYYCRIIFISCPHYLCVVWLVSNNNSENLKKVVTVGCPL